MTKNNAKTVENTLQSISELNANIFIIDLKSTDNTYEICRKYTENVYIANLNGDFSRIRNDIVSRSKTDWQMWMEPWEILTTGHQEIKNVLSEKINYRLMILRGSDMIMKELRLWRKSSGISFRRPAFESLEPEGNPGFLSSTMIYTEPYDNLNLTTELITQWKNSNPTLAEVDYYLAMSYLMHKKYDTFLNLAEHFLFKVKEIDQSVIMIKYYCAMILLHVKKNYKKALEYIVDCLMVKPMMAEFWCLLGDIYLHQKEFQRAKFFYKNAIDLGSQRLQDDPMPLEIPKYDEYPNKIIEAINQHNDRTMI